MAIYHLTTKVFSRGKGQSAIAAAAYRSGERLFDELTGEQKFYRSKSDRILFNGIFVPSLAPDWSRDRNQFWNRAERAETRKDGRLAREIEVSLPHELTDEQRQWLVADFVREAFLRKGYGADVAIHAPYRGSDQRNYHAHIMISERQLEADGFAAKKNPAMNSREQLATWREQWAKLANRHLERHGHDARIDHRSLEAQGIELEPTVHLGYAAVELVKRGAQSDRADEFVGIVERNGIRLDLQAADKDLARLELMDEAGREPGTSRAHPSQGRKAMIEEPFEQQLRRQAQREADLLEELRESETRAQHYRLTRQAEADEARKRLAEQQDAEDRRAREGDISQAPARYAIALGQAYDVRDPYASLARAAMVESAMFHRNQEKMREQIAKEADLDKRRIIELRSKIEGCEYMAITNDRLAGIGVAITGQRDNRQAATDRANAEQYREQAAALRKERSQLIEATLQKEKDLAPAQKTMPAEPVQQGTPAATKAPEQKAPPVKNAQPEQGRFSTSPPASRTRQDVEARPPQRADEQRPAEPPAAPARAAPGPAVPTPPREPPVAVSARLATTWPAQEPSLPPKAQRDASPTQPKAERAETGLQPPAPRSEKAASETVRDAEKTAPRTERTPVNEPARAVEPSGPEQQLPPSHERVLASRMHSQNILPYRDTRVTRPADQQADALRQPEQAPAPWKQPEQGLQVKDSETGRLLAMQDYARAMPPAVTPERSPPNLFATFNDPAARRKQQLERLNDMDQHERAEKALDRIGKHMASGKPVETKDLKDLHREQWESVRKHGETGLRQVVKEAQQRVQGRGGGRGRED